MYAPQAEHLRGGHSACGSAVSRRSTRCCEDEHPVLPGGAPGSCRGSDMPDRPTSGTSLPPRAEEFVALRPLLFAIAYRVLGRVTEAEDVVQDTWLHYQHVTEQPRSPKAYLATVVTRLSINVLSSARVRREEYIGEWFPEPLLEDPYQEPERAAELADSVSTAALVLLERLSPLERAAFVLREVFGSDYADVADTLGRSEGACRQLVV